MLAIEDATHFWETARSLHLRDISKRTTSAGSMSSPMDTGLASYIDGEVLWAHDARLLVSISEWGKREGKRGGGNVRIGLQVYFFPHAYHDLICMKCAIDAKVWYHCCDHFDALRGTTDTLKENPAGLHIRYNIHHHCGRKTHCWHSAWIRSSHELNIRRMPRKNV